MSRQEMTTDKDNEMRVTTKEQRSNMFAAFEPAQIREFKLFFNIIDQNHDGLIDKSDLHGVFVSLGKDPTDDYLEGMMNDATSPIDFTTFLMLFDESFQGMDPGNVLKNAFGHFDKNNEGVVDAEQLRDILVTAGDKFTDGQVDELYREAPIANGLFNYVEFTCILKHGPKE